MAKSCDQMRRVTTFVFKKIQIDSKELIFVKYPKFSKPFANHYSTTAKEKQATTNSTKMETLNQMIFKTKRPILNA